MREGKRGKLGGLFVDFVLVSSYLNVDADKWMVKIVGGILRRIRRRARAPRCDGSVEIIKGHNTRGTTRTCSEPGMYV